ncbi:S8 family serine peptidase [Streptomyces sp. NPDC048629]|uniref:S8 family peptidase n=1 Tax=Streptomyces sp. NPDC048629 TaxID=3154824 RepID=UPI003417B625
MTTSTAPGASGRPGVTVTLITGDRVSIDAKGRLGSIDHAPGRERIPVRISSEDGHTFAVPLDAQPLIAAGRLDPRLFDVTELARAENVKAQRGGLKVIVGYSGAAAPKAKAGVKAAGGTKVARSLTSLNAEAVVTPRAHAAELWTALTDGTGAGTTTTAGIAHVWLDGVLKATLDKSVAQIGAPKAWSAGYDGKGVKIAVLDTGVDATHPDLKGKVIAQQNFTESPDAVDHYGHGTHVASIAAGTGAASGGAFKGVAPGAELLSGKVLDDEGRGSESQILAGIEWAAAQGADVVNLSLGGRGTEGTDPVEAAIDRLSAERGLLFAVSAGNNGGPVGSPGTARSALTVGAVDDADALAPFSSRGSTDPATVKPDVTAPGVDITAAAAPGSVIEREVGQRPEGYLTISGTSMAAPHVAGAAALLKQRHPGWKASELKGVLTGSTKGGPYTPFEQGSGRVQVDRAIEQTVFAEPVSLGFGLARWPHADDPAITRKVTYRNAGDKDVTLALALTTLDPQKQPAPAGFFALGATSVTVPAGGTASVDLTADTTLGAADGTFSAYVTATGDGQSVRTAATVEREVESYDVTVRHIGRDGKPTADYRTRVGFWGELPQDSSGTTKLRVRKGTYPLTSYLPVDPADFAKGFDWLVQPALKVDGATTVTLDARGAEPVDITVPDPKAKPSGATAFHTLRQGYMTSVFGFDLDSFAGVRAAYLGPDMEEGLRESWNASWTTGDDVGYHVTLGGPVKRFSTGYTRHLERKDLAAVKTGLGASAPGKTGLLQLAGLLPGADIWPVQNPVERPLPNTRTLYLSTLDQVRWEYNFSQTVQGSDGLPVIEVFQWLNDQSYQGGRSYALALNTAVFGPRIGGYAGIGREGDEIHGDVPMFVSGAADGGDEDPTSAKTLLYRDGTRIGESDAPLSRSAPFTVPADDAGYRLTTSVVRDPAVARTSSRIDASWSFRSKRTEEATALPVSMVRFGAATALDGTAPAGRIQLMPVTVQGAAAGSNLKALEVYASYDDARTWTRLVVTDGKVAVRNPAKDKGVALRAEVTDKDGNVSTVAIHDAYFGR